MTAPQKVKWTPEAVEQKVIQIVAEELDVEPDKVRLDSRFLTDLPTDSLEMIQIAMTCEDEFEINMPQEVELQTVGEIVAYVTSQLSETKPE